VQRGEAVALVPYDGAVLDLLVRLRWLAEADVADKVKVGAAISAMLRDAAKR
jgi:hypothetical protein